MGRALLAVVTSGLVAAVTLSALATQGDQLMLIRNGYVVPPGQTLRVDDMSVDCVIASEIFDEQEFKRFGVVATAYL
ncbi:MAG TPA: hypothetical protein VGH36_12865 [Acetobacteraceae bacterium]|jgi:hypothetical protein